MKEKEKCRRCKRALLVLLFSFAAIVLLVGTVTAVTHTEVEGVTRYAPTGPAADEEFEVTLRITGELPLVVGIVETIPSGFSFASTTHPAGNYSVSGQKVAFAVINATGIKYRVKAPSSGEGIFKGTWVDMLSENEGGIADTIIIVGGGGASAIEEGFTATPSPTPFVPAVTKATRSIPVIEAGKAVAMIFEDMDVRLISLKVDTNVSDVKVVVERIERAPDTPEPSGTAYAYLDIKVENAEGAKIEGKVEFKVANSWISDNNIDETTVKLNRYEKGEWGALPTSKVGEDDNFLYFEAETPGFSTFVVTGEKAAAETPTPTPVATPTATPAATPTQTPTATPASEVPGFEVILTAVALLIVYTVVLRKRVKGGDVK